MTYVKICGCRSVENALAARDAGADFIGLVFAESRRRVTLETARGVAAALGYRAGLPGVESQGGGSDGAGRLERLLSERRPLLVGVFEGPATREIEQLAEEACLDVLQLHGDMLFDDGLCARWPSIRATSAEFIGARDQGPAMCMVDSSRGRGEQGDWDAVAAVSSRIPLILAGGLTPDNVAAAVRRVRPWGVDVSSGVETEGRKDALKMREFVAAAKGALGS